MNGNTKYDFSKWQRFLSYITDYPLDQFSSEKNGPMELVLSNGQLRLTTKNAIYSYGKHYKSFGNAFDELNIEELAFKEILVLGWGMGSIAELLSGHPTINKITGIEYDSVLIDFYEQLSLMNSFEIELINENVFGFLEAHKLKYDLVCSDIFEDNLTPDQIVSKEYIIALNGLLNPKGMVLMSKLNRSIRDINQNKKLTEILNDLGISFKTVKTLGNSIFYWRKD